MVNEYLFCHLMKSTNWTRINYVQSVTVLTYQMTTRLQNNAGWTLTTHRTCWSVIVPRVLLIKSLDQVYFKLILDQLPENYVLLNTL